jgi:PTH1 family peptidyl-tRNA hydrolase
MKLIIGLGNPGKDYENTRHNAGFLAVEKLRLNLNFPDWKNTDKFKANISEGTIDDQKVILVQPTTFMNLSGQAVAAISKFYKVAIKDIFIIHDDLNLELGRIRISHGGSSGGHKGIESIIESVGSKDFPRFRIGIGTKDINKDAAAFVLQRFKKEEQKIIKTSISDTADALILSIKKGIEAAMNKYNRRKTNDFT